jgi:hypothetical protein
MDVTNAMDATSTPDLHAELCAAITKRSLVMFEYGDLIRVVEPHRFGINSAGHAMLSGWLRAGYSRSDPAGGWRNYLVHDIHDLQVLDAPFAGPRPGYAAHDHRMREVFAQLAPSSTKIALEGPYVVREPMPGPAAEPPDVAAAGPRMTPADAATAHDDEAGPPDAPR